LHQAVVGDGVKATAGGGVETDPLHRQGIDITVGVPEVGFEGLPGVVGGEALQEQGHAVVAELDGADGLSDGGLEGVVELLGPALDG
jgi:hypothetical protein